MRVGLHNWHAIWEIYSAMGNIQNISGAAGEYLAAMELMRPIATGAFLFDAVLLGGKEPTYDYIVYLLDANSDRYGPFCFLQVKTTTRKPAPGGAYPLAFSATDVARAHASKIPFFVCIVDRAVPRAERIFIKGVDSDRKAGISRLAPTHDLAADAVKLELHQEVERVWSMQSAPVLKRLI
jgi:hypothetical protein